jgi:hypothetical protein
VTGKRRKEERNYGLPARTDRGPMSAFVTKYHRQLTVHNSPVANWPVAAGYQYSADLALNSPQLTQKGIVTSIHDVHRALRMPTGAC